MDIKCGDELNTWLRMDHWTGHSASLILSDMLPDWVDFAEMDNELARADPDVRDGPIYACATICRRPDQSRAAVLSMSNETDYDALVRLSKSHDEKIYLMRQRFERGEQELMSPEKWIDWALEKNLKINWLEYALKAGFFKNIRSLVESSEILRHKYYHQKIQSEPDQVMPLSATLPTPTHSTRLLTILAAAADRFWSLYDPSEPSTAPTNDQVTAWLVSEKVPTRTAEVMATILRADGLPTGRRK